jgi:hypothetical protein
MHMMVRRPIEAFKIPLTGILQTMRGLDLFKESSIGFYFGMVLRNKLAAILEPLVPKPMVPKPPAKIKAKPKSTAGGPLKTGRPKRQADQPMPRMAA